MRQCSMTPENAITKQICHRKVSSSEGRPQGAGALRTQSPVPWGRSHFKCMTSGNLHQNRKTIETISNVSSRKENLNLFQQAEGPAVVASHVLPAPQVPICAGWRQLRPGGLLRGFLTGREGLSAPAPTNTVLTSKCKNLQQFTN